MDSKEQKPKKSVKSILKKIILISTITFIVLMAVLFGFMQTSSFRTILKNQVKSIANGELRGKLNIGKIDGTILTSLILRDVSLVYETDTIAAIKLIAISIKPTDAIWKNITAKSVIIENAKINLQYDSLGVLNLTKALPAPKVKTDTTKSEFPFQIYVDNLDLKDINFALRSYDKRNSNEYYKSLNSNDLRAQLNHLSLAAFANINALQFSIRIRDLDISPNLKNTSNIKLAGEFEIDSSSINLDKISIKTPNSDLLLSTHILNLHLFSNFDLSKSELSLFLDAKKFNFEDLTTFVSSVDYLQGALKATLIAEGSFKKLDVRELSVDYGRTTIKSSGTILHLDNPSKMYFDYKITNSVLDPALTTLLLPSFGIPDYSSIGLVTIDSISYNGKPDNFRSGMKLMAKDGSISGNVALDLRFNEPAFTVNANLNNFDLSPFIYQKSRFSGVVKAEGKNFDISKMSATIDIKGNHSTFNNLVIDTLSLATTVNSGNFDLVSTLHSDSLAVALNGNVDFKNMDQPAYNLFVKMKNLNLKKVVSDSLVATDLNADVHLEGTGFDPEKISATLQLATTDSYIKNRKLKDINAEARFFTNENKLRNLLVRSTLADITLSGYFNFTTLTRVMTREIDSVSEQIYNKIDKYYPLKNQKISKNLTTIKQRIPQRTASRVGQSDSTRGIIDISFGVIVKDISPLALFMEGTQIKVEGAFSGKLAYQRRKEFEFSVTADFKEIEMIDKESDMIIADSKTVLNYSHPANNYKFEQLNTSIKSTTKRVYLIGAGEPLTLKDIALDGRINNSTFTINNAAIGVNDNILASLKATSDFTKDSLVVNLTKANIKYNDYELTTPSVAYLSFNNDKLLVKDLSLARNGALFTLNAGITNNKIDTATIAVKGFNLYDFGYSALSINPEDMVGGDLNMGINIGGTLESPVMTGYLKADSLGFRGSNLGVLNCSLKYADKRLYPYFQYLGNKRKTSDSLLVLEGVVPIDLSITNFSTDIIQTDSVSLRMRADNFSLAPYGRIIPFITKINGIISGYVSFHGYYPNLVRQGTLRLRDAKFTVQQNNLEYNAGVKLRLADSTVYIDSVLLSNTAGVERKGTIKGSGRISYHGFDIISSQIILNGDLTVLSNSQRARDLDVYGDLYVVSDGDIVYSQNGKNTFLKAGIIVKQCNLIFPPLQNSYYASTDNFVYRYVEDTTKIKVLDPEQKRWEQITARYKQKKSQIKASLPEYFGYQIKVKMQDEARMTFIFAEEANQRLIARLKGEINYLLENGIQDIQGELSLLDGSTLEMMNLKTFKATGKLKFEREITNPYLDITGTYRSYYLVKAKSAEASVEKEVAVKVKLKGALSELSNNFLRSEDNIAVYIGTDNIENNSASTEYDKADAVWFILTGKFKNDLTAKDKTDAVDQINAFQGTATSVAGNLLGGLLSSYLGDYVQSLEIRSTGSATKFSVSGKISDIQYSFGGTTNLLNDISSASFRFDIPIIQNFLIRVERKESVKDLDAISDMINELGLKYRFEF